MPLARLGQKFAIEPTVANRPIADVRHVEKLVLSTCHERPGHILWSKILCNKRSRVTVMHELCWCETTPLRQTNPIGLEVP